MSTNKEKHAGGAPTKYKQEYCDQVIEFFNQEPYKPLMKENDDGDEVAIVNQHGKAVLIPCPLPTKEAFATSIGVHRDTLLNWAKEYTEFFGAIKKAEDYQKNILIQNGLIGNYDKTFAIFVAKNVTDMNDRQDINTNVSIVSDTGKYEW